MKYFSLFSGVGGFEIGITNAYAYHRLVRQEGQTFTIPRRQKKVDGPGVGDSQALWNNDEPDEPTATCVGFSELDRFASDVLRYHYPETKNYGDITKIDWSAVPDFDLLVGGSPCQSFSIAGKRAGFNGASGLFWEYLRCLKEKKPEHFIWENVKGVLSSNSGRDFAIILSAFSEAGYSLWWQVLNAKDFGVPQNRERIFVVGTRSGSPREVFFENGTGHEDPVANDAGTVYEKTRRLSDAFRIRGTDGVSATLKGLGGGMGAKTGLYAIPVVARGINHPSRGIEVRRDELAATIKSGESGTQKPKALIGRKIRRLTPRECERLMSWPDDHTHYGCKVDGTVYEVSDSQRYKMCGNGVVSKVVEELVRNIF